VMVQCYSGAFGNLIFTGGDPRNGLADREVAGFFATIRDRMAAGCTTEVNEANYQDFSSHFFAALIGRDRVGRTVRGADYNADGRVGMDEAFAYCLMNDASIDVPVCTSDIFLRWALPVANEEVFQTGYTQVREWATPAQRIALDSLSRALKLTGESRPADAYRMMLESERRRVDPSLGQAMRRFRAAREEGRAAMLERWPDLIDPRATDYQTIRREAVAELARRVADGRLRELLEADEALTQLEEQQYKAELEEARVLRFVRLAKSIVLAHRLRESGDATLRERFERLLKAEAGSLLTRPNS